ncbi:hypothetical protein DUNSADRAFT_11290 [Dunaliella salina]|uniref:Encoded protein n=1 Tax=Dunaliella salina TaxID=3046 RepID=A0ABQ7FRX9_DUNSA|nr:hypothetical protein DUNSADRAFT_11290 [Dunaliella salina]|eukprot:KAF5825351.1 hypothetical protein DUNSADRAFT_11290 [Dunaliella salina]
MLRHKVQELFNLSLAAMQHGTYVAQGDAKVANCMQTVHWLRQHQDLLNRQALPLEYTHHQLQTLALFPYSFSFLSLYCLSCISIILLFRCFLHKSRKNMKWRSFEQRN